MRRIVLITICAFLVVVILIVSFGCSVYDPYRKGKVIDANTGEPIEDVVVKGCWKIQYFPLYFFGGPPFNYAKKKTLTDEKGNFTLGLGPWLYPGLLKTPIIYAYKEDYKTKRFWGMSKSKLERYDFEAQWDNNRRVIHLRMTDEEKSGGSTRPLCFPHSGEIKAPPER